MERTTFYIKLQFASTVLFWSCLWAVKGCFLAFFYKMTEGLKPQRTMLWVVAVITALSYIGSVITYPISCTSFKPGLSIFQNFMSTLLTVENRRVLGKDQH